MMMKSAIAAACLAGLALGVLLVAAAGRTGAAEDRHLRVLMVTGGCCHDYDRQKTLLSEGITERVEEVIEWTIVHEGGDARDHKLSVFSRADWADDYDVVIHNTCFGDTADAEFIESFVDAHGSTGTGAVFLHCAMHSYRHQDETDAYRELVGVRSMRHEGHRPLAVENIEPDHRIMTGFPETWDTPNGELYVIEKVWPNVRPLARAYGEDTGEDHLVAWTNSYGDARVFGTTLGHHNETMEHPVYLDLVARGLLWTVNRLD